MLSNSAVAKLLPKFNECYAQCAQTYKMNVLGRKDRNINLHYNVFRLRLILEGGCG